MEELDEFKVAISNVIQIAENIQNNITREIFAKAPVVVHQRFCHELVEVMKKHPNEIPKDIPEVMIILNSIHLLEELYPEIKCS